jgi:putative transposase
VRRTYQYRANVNRATEANAIRWLSLCCSLYNAAVEQRRDAWYRCRKSVSGYDQAKELPILKKIFPQYATVSAQVLQDVVERLDRAYQQFFSQLKSGKKAGLPGFCRQQDYRSVTLKNQCWRLEGRNLYVSNLGRFKLFLSRPVEGRIKTVTIRLTVSGKWLVSFSCADVPEQRLPQTGKSVGIDVGLRHFIVDSNGGEVAPPCFLRKSEKVLRRRQRRLCRRKKRSAGRAKAKALVAKMHEKIRNQRLDFIRKTARSYVKRYDVIHIEDLKIHNMARNSRLSKSILDAAWGIFFSVLSEMAESAGKIVLKVNARGTTSECHQCGTNVPKKLSDRIHSCPVCGIEIDRDLNAARVIENRPGQGRQAPTVPVGAAA